ncbi:MAG: hypothetical protein LUF85_06750 [Bacteroides sp.]|nr:hypothetical protein [Bacteroides sp.]
MALLLLVSLGINYLALASFTITPYGYGAIGFILFSLFITFGIKRRMEKQSSDKKSMGCMSMGYIWVVVFFVGILAISLTSICLSKTLSGMHAILAGECYKAAVVDWTSEWSQDSDGESTEYYYSILEFTTKEGHVITRKTNFGSSECPQKVEEYTIYYVGSSDYMFVWGKHILFFLFATLVIGSVWVFAFIGIMRYALGYSMKSYLRSGNRFLFVFFLPFVMILFIAALVY